MIRGRDNITEQRKFRNKGIFILFACGEAEVITICENLEIECSIFWSLELIIKFVLRLSCIVIEKKSIKS